MFKLNKRRAVKKRFKSRHFVNPTTLQRVGYRRQVVVYVKTSGMLGSRLYSRLIGKFRRFVKKRKYQIRFKANINSIRTGRSIGTRMGKGKGKIVGFSLKVRTNQIFAICRGLARARVWNFFKKENQRSAVKFSTFEIGPKIK